MLAAFVPGGLFAPLVANAESAPAGGVTIPAGGTLEIVSATSYILNGTPVASSPFPIKIMANGSYTIKGSYTQDINNKLARVSPEGLINTNGVHGIYVDSGLRGVTVTLDGVGIVTTGKITTAAFFINGVQSANQITLYADYTNKPQSTDVVVNLVNNNCLYSGKGQISGNRAGLETWKGASVFIEGSGTLLAKSTDSRAYDSGTYPTTAQGGPYYDVNIGTLYEHGSQSTLGIGTGTQNGGAAGIGSGNISGSGGNVVVRGNPTVVAISGAHGAGIGGGWSNSAEWNYYSNVLIYGGNVESWGVDMVQVLAVDAPMVTSLLDNSREPLFYFLHSK